MGSSNCEVVNEGKEGDSADKVHYPGRLGVFGVDDGYNRLIVAPHQDTLPRPGGAPQDTCQVDGEYLLPFDTDAPFFVKGVFWEPVTLEP